MRTLLLCAVVLALAGCATPYQKNTLGGGYKETQLAPDLWRVSFQGNGYTAPERAQDFALLRAAELAHTNGYPWFAIVKERTTERTQTVNWTGGSGHTTGTITGSGNYAYLDAHTSYTPGQSTTFYFPNTGLLVQGFREKPAGIFTFDAAFLAQSIRKTYNLK